MKRFTPIMNQRLFQAMTGHVRDDEIQWTNMHIKPGVGVFLKDHITCKPDI